MDGFTLDNKKYAVLTTTVLIGCIAYFVSWGQLPREQFQTLPMPNLPSGTSDESNLAESNLAESNLAESNLAESNLAESIPNYLDQPLVAVRPAPAVSQQRVLQQQPPQAQLQASPKLLELLPAQVATRHGLKRPVARPRFDLTISGAASEDANASVNESKATNVDGNTGFETTNQIRQQTAPQQPSSQQQPMSTQTQPVLLQQNTATESGLLEAQDQNQIFSTPVPVQTPTDELANPTLQPQDVPIQEEPLPVLELLPSPTAAEMAPAPTLETPQPIVTAQPMPLPSGTLPSGPIPVGPIVGPAFGHPTSVWADSPTPLSTQPVPNYSASAWGTEPWTHQSEPHFAATGEAFDCGPGGQCSKLTFGGWASAGIHSQNDALFNDRPEEFVLHQAWVFAEKTATQQQPLGFRFDAVYGIDGRDTQAFGNNPGRFDYQNGLEFGENAWAVPQAYLELQLGGWNAKAGHFFTPLGYETVTAPDNFFYSHSMTMYNTEPFTHTGILVQRDLGDIEVYAGWTLGWDTGFDRFDGGSSWLGGIAVDVTSNATLSYFSTAGDLGRRGEDAYSQSIVLNTDVTESLHYVLQSDYLRVGSTGEDNVGVNQYLLYTISRAVAVGARFEWWKGDVLTGYAPHGGVLPTSGSLSYYATTFGVNLRPLQRFVLRPEVRYDWSPAANYSQANFGIDAVLTF